MPIFEWLTVLKRRNVPMFNYKYTDVVIKLSHHLSLALQISIFFTGQMPDNIQMDRTNCLTLLHTHGVMTGLAHKDF